MIETSRHCPQCGSPCAADIKFCGQCGTPLGPVPSPHQPTLMGVPQVPSDPTLAGVPDLSLAKTMRASIPPPSGGGATMHGVPDPGVAARAEATRTSSRPPPRPSAAGPSAPRGPEISAWSEEVPRPSPTSERPPATGGTSERPPATARTSDRPPARTSDRPPGTGRTSDRPRYAVQYAPDVVIPPAPRVPSSEPPALPVSKVPLYAGIALVAFGVLAGLVALGTVAMGWVESVRAPRRDTAPAPLAPAVASTVTIDSPGFEVFTEADGVVVSGAVHQDSTLTIDGARVPVNNGRFSHRFPLPRVGDYVISVVATEPGHAPAERILKVRRVADLEAEAATYPIERELDYATIAAEPTAHRGKRVELRGRVYDLQVEEGRSRLQMVVADCPAGSSCPVWVTHPAPVEVRVGDWIRILGEVAGTQQFRPRGREDEILSVPRIEARYVLPVGS